jgi:Ca2+/Na+ antiporter
MVPTSTTNTLMDNVHNLTFTFILLVVLLTIITLNLYHTGDEKKIFLSKKIDRIAFFSIITVYAIANVVLILNASR